MCGARQETFFPHNSDRQGKDDGTLLQRTLPELTATVDILECEVIACLLGVPEKHATVDR